MSFWEDAVNTVERKGGEVIQISKLSYQITTLKNSIRSKYEELGRYTYQAAKKETEDAEYRGALIAEITELQEKLVAAQCELNRVKGAQPCEQCGQVNPAAAEFCSRCGNKLG